MQLHSRSAADRIEGKIDRGDRLDFEDGMEILTNFDLLRYGRLANRERERRHGDRAYYVINFHLNPTNICVYRCMFCAFRRDEGEAGAYFFEVPHAVEHCVEAHRRLGFTEIHMVGGMHPTRHWEYSLDLLRALKAALPQVHLKAFTAVEIQFFARVTGLPVEAVLERMVDAGLDSLPGGGAEIFAPRVRRAICAEKASAEEWLSVHRLAHRMGLKSTSTMLYGHIERPEEVVDHILRIRDLQDETSGFNVFIPLAFHPENTNFESTRRPTTGLRDLKMLVLSRLLLDNVSHIKAYWIMLGEKLSQVALSFGVDDFDGTVGEEKITHMAGATTPQELPTERIRRIIREAGRVPVQRDSLYDLLEMAGVA
ncbi:MAG: aminofutalosine synthase MqnE [Candidatus Lindowbacteria bacterium RIFCSPLOWO2_12_FULL_62_27]|nr:MAG: aminofutalosine synthase MqnE [Candidatus Lindowbacteria bacterium RIFCSPLOWO2_12_FULL_62_27]OGH63355.1 MAG: aminofutalosine synthase MqnE [Candidatus Lindowbacteria bacterium RIFCSPLOWO2_02_FULL_62_12]